MPYRPTGYTPFFMVYEAEAIPLTDIDHGSPCIYSYDEIQSEEVRQDIVDQLKEAREVALLRSAKYQ